MTIKKYINDMNKSKQETHTRISKKGKLFIAGKSPEKIKISRTDNPEFNKYALNVVTNIHKDFPNLLKHAKRLESEFNIKVDKVGLSGSYSKGKANENSDIDIAVYYKGDIDPNKIIEALLPLHGSFGDYDVHPIKIK